MRKCISAAILVSAVSMGGDEPQTKSPHPKGDPAAIVQPTTEMIRDPRWMPEAGKRVVIQSVMAPAATSQSAFAEFADATLAGDNDAIQELRRQKKIVNLDRGTPVLVMVDHGAPPPTTSRSSSSSGVATQLLNSGLLVLLESDPIEVRVLTGDKPGKPVFINRNDIAKMVEMRRLPSLMVGAKAVVAEPWSVIAGEHTQLYDHRLATMDGDRPAIIRMVREGRLTKLDGGVKVVILGTQGDFARVRIHSGSKMAGNVGFMPARDLIPMGNGR